MLLKLLPVKLSCRLYYNHHLDPADTRPHGMEVLSIISIIDSYFGRISLC